MGPGKPQHPKKNPEVLNPAPETGSPEAPAEAVRQEAEVILTEAQACASSRAEGFAAEVRGLND